MWMLQKWQHTAGGRVHLQSFTHAGHDGFDKRTGSPLVATHAPSKPEFESGAGYLQQACWIESINAWLAVIWCMRGFLLLKRICFTSFCLGNCVSGIWPGCPAHSYVGAASSAVHCTLLQAEGLPVCYLSGCQNCPRGKGLLKGAAEAQVSGYIGNGACRVTRLRLRCQVEEPGCALGL